MTVPEKLEFEFAAVTKNGSVSTNFQECITEDEGNAKGRVGSRPAVTAEVETKNGNIRVER